MKVQPTDNERYPVPAEYWPGINAALEAYRNLGEGDADIAVRHERALTYREGFAHGFVAASQHIHLIQQQRDHALAVLATGIAARR